MTEPLRFIPPRVPLIDPRTGTVTREWYLFFQGVFNRIGGATGQTNTDMAQNLSDDAGVEEIRATLFASTDALGQVPTAPEPAVVELLLAELHAQRELITEMSKEIQSLKQGYQL